MLRKILCVLLVCVLTSCSSSVSNSKLVGREAPLARLVMLDGTMSSLDAYQGKTVVLMFWASWCRKSGPIIQKLEGYARQLGPRSNVAFVAVSIDKPDGLPKLKDKISLMDLKTIHLAYSGNEIYDEAYMAFDADSLPAIFVINPQGTVVASGDDEEVVLNNVPGLRAN